MFDKELKQRWRWPKWSKVETWLKFWNKTVAVKCHNFYELVALSTTQPLFNFISNIYVFYPQLWFQTYNFQHSKFVYSQVNHNLFESSIFCTPWWPMPSHVLTVTLLVWVLTSLQLNWTVTSLALPLALTRVPESLCQSSKKDPLIQLCLSV